MKILILAYTTGVGYDIVAKALYDKLVSLGINAELVYSGFLGTHEKASFMENLNNKIIINAPPLSNVVYNIGKMYNKSPLANKSKDKKLFDYVTSSDIDAIICCHEYAIKRIANLKQTMKLKVPCYGLVTDYRYIPDVSDRNLDGYFLPHNYLKDEYIKRGINKNKIFVTGIPVDEQFTKDITKQEARNYLILPQNKYIYLVSTQGMSDKNVLYLCDELDKNMLDNSIVYVLVSRNKDIRDKINKSFSNLKIRPITYTEKLYYYIKSADVIISKPIGYLSTISANFLVPNISIFATREAEKENARYMEKIGITTYANTEHDAIILANDIMMDDKLKEEYIKNYNNGIKYNAIDNIINVMMKMKGEK